MDDQTVQVATPSRAARRVLTFGVGLMGAAVCLGAAALLLRAGPAVSATAAGWLAGMDHAGSVLDDGLGAIALRRIAHLGGLGPAPALRLLQLMVVALVLGGVVRAAWQLRGPGTAALALAMVLAWPASRQALQTLSVEGVMAACSVWLVAGWLSAAEMPLRAAMLSALSLTILVLVHPVGLAAAPCLALALLLAPGPAPSPHGNQPPLLAVRPLWLPWVLSVAGALALLSAGLPTGSIKTIWVHAIGTLRAPVSGLHLGVLASLPVLGPLVALGAQVPAPLLLLAVGPGVRARLQRHRPESLVALVAAAWLCVAASIGLPVPDSLDLLVVLAPLLCVLAASTVWDLGQSALQAPGWSSRVSAGVLALALIAAWGADARLGRDDRRSGLGHLPGLLRFTSPLRPALLTPEDAALLASHLEPTAILPGQTGGSRVADALKVVDPGLKTASFGPAYTAALILLPARRSSPVDEAFAQAGLRIACTASGDNCLYRLRGRPDTRR